MLYLIYYRFMPIKVKVGGKKCVFMKIKLKVSKAICLYANKSED